MHCSSGCRALNCKLLPISWGKTLIVSLLSIVFVSSFSLQNTVLLQHAIASLKTPEIVVQLGHTGYGIAAAVTSDNKYLITGSNGFTAKLWDIHTGKEIRTFAGHHDNICAIAITHDNRFVITGSYDYTAKLWDINTGRLLRTFKGHKEIVRSLSVSLDNRFLFTGSGDYTIKQWEISTGKLLKTFKTEHTYTICSLTLTPDNRFIITGGWDNSVEIIERSTGKVKRKFITDSDSLWSVALTSDSNFFIIGGKDNNSEMWDIRSGTRVRVFTGHKNNVVPVIITHDGQFLLTGSNDNTAKMWDIVTGKEIRTFSGHSGGVYSIVVTTDDKYLITVSGDNTAKLWDIATGQEIRTFPVYTQSVLALTLTTDDKYLITAGVDGIARVWDLTTIKQIKAFQEDSLGIYALSTAFHNKYIVTANGYYANFWDLQSGAKLKSILTEDVKSGSAIGDMAVTYDNKYLITANANKPLKLWDMETGTKIREFDKPSSTGNHTAGGLSCVVPLRNRNHVVAGSADTSAQLWDLKIGKTIKKFIGHSDSINALDVTSDDRYFVTGSDDKTAKMWDIESGKEVRTFIGHKERITALTITFDGKYLITGSKDSLVIIWDIHSGKKIYVFKAHSGEITAILNSHDNKYIFTASEDGTTKMWKLSSGKELATFISINKNEYVAMLPDNYYQSSKTGAKNVSWRFGNTIYPFEQFDLKYNRPDLVLERLGNADKNLIAAYKNAYTKRLKKMGFKEEDLSGELHIPKVKIDLKKVAVESKDKIFKISISAKDDKYKLDRINVYVNDVAAFGTKGISIKKERVKSFKKIIPVELSNGYNKIQISALNEKGAESYQETIYVTYTGEYKKPDLYLLTVGTSKYKNSVYNLRYAVKDAEDIANLFAIQNELFGNIFTMKVEDENATKENILQTRDFLTKSKVDDTVVLFVAGHGMVDNEQNYYYGTHDIDLDNPKKRGLPFEEFENLLDGISARKKVFFVDTCFSGEVEKSDDIMIAKGVAADLTGSVKVRSFIDKRGVFIKSKVTEIASQFQEGLFNDLRKGTGAVIISSSSGDEYSYEGEQWKNGVFTYSVIEGLKMKLADANQDDKITVSEIRDYVIERVRQLTNGGQNPTVRRDNIENDFVIYQ